MKRVEPEVPRKLTLAAETALLMRADDALKAGRFDEALRLLSEHGRLCPDGELTIEREVIEIDVLVGSGRQLEARERAEVFLRRHPNSPQATRVTRSLQRQP